MPRNLLHMIWTWSAAITSLGVYKSSVHSTDVMIGSLSRISHHLSWVISSPANGICDLHVSGCYRRRRFCLSVLISMRHKTRCLRRSCPRPGPLDWLSFYDLLVMKSVNLRDLRCVMHGWPLDVMLRRLSVSGHPRLASHPRRIHPSAE